MVKNATVGVSPVFGEDFHKTANQKIFVIQSLADIRNGKKPLPF